MVAYFLRFVAGRRVKFVVGTPLSSLATLLMVHFVLVLDPVSLSQILWVRLSVSWIVLLFGTGVSPVMTAPMVVVVVLVAVGLERQLVVSTRVGILRMFVRQLSSPPCMVVEGPSLSFRWQSR